MSGFAGVISLDGAPPDQRLLERMAQTLAFRGPDGTHITTKPGAGFCFTFLRTGPAPQCPAQPCSLDGKVWLLGDVRLDGRDDLGRKLEQFGDEIGAEATDEELVLRAWRRWREHSLPDLIGDYSFTLWDAEARQLWCARDLMGARPFFYAQIGNHLYFSNTLSAIRCASDISSTLDERFIGDFLLEGYCLDPALTVFRDVLRLPAGHVLQYSTAGLDVHRCLSMPIYEPLWLKCEQEYVENFHELLTQAVLDRLPRSRAAIFMSGGLDSTSIAAIAMENAKTRELSVELRAFNLDYRPTFDGGETELTYLAARHIGIPLAVLCGASCFPYGGWNESPPQMPEPCHEPYQALQVERFRQAAEYSPIVLNGYGGDGVMSGQSWPYLVWLWRRRRLGKITRDFGGYTLRNGRVPPLRAGIRSGLKRWFKRSAQADPTPAWLAPQFENELRTRPRESSKGKEEAHPWYSIDYATLNGSWAGVLEAEDAAWIGVPVEARAPLLDQRVQSFLLRIPPVPLCAHKEILRRTMKGFLPEKVRLRPKTPFGGDVMGLQIASGQWKPLPLPELHDEIHRFVDCQKLEVILQGDTRSLWTNLRPISLIYWLRILGSSYTGATS